MPPVTGLTHTWVRIKSPVSGVVNTVSVWFEPVRDTVAATNTAPWSLLMLLFDKLRFDEAQEIVAAIMTRKPAIAVAKYWCLILFPFIYSWLETAASFGEFTVGLSI
jgi:hypothetical protein